MITEEQARNLKPDDKLIICDFEEGNSLNDVIVTVESETRYNIQGDLCIPIIPTHCGKLRITAMGLSFVKIFDMETLCCVCNIQSLMIRGCKCGAMTKERMSHNVV